jgi:hypothetical protein
LRQEISVRLQELTDSRVPCGDALRREYELLLKPASDAPAADDAMLRAFLLRVLETIQWSAKKKYLAQPIHRSRPNGCCSARWWHSCSSWRPT